MNASNKQQITEVQLLNGAILKTYMRTHSTLISFSEEYSLKSVLIHIFSSAELLEHSQIPRTLLESSSAQ